MNALQKIKAAQTAATDIINSYRAGIDAAPDVVEVRKAQLLAELEGMKNVDKIDHLISKIVTLEAPKADVKVKTEDVARSLMESTACATLTWGDIADLIITNGLGEKTSAASIASYASKRKDIWNIVPRERLKFTSADVMAASQLITSEADVVEPEPVQEVVNG